MITIAAAMEGKHTRTHTDTQGHTRTYQHIGGKSEKDEVKEKRMIEKCKEMTKMRKTFE